MNSERLGQQLITDEGLHLKPYRDSAKPPRLTIGVGRNLDARGITKDEALYLLRDDIADTWSRLCRALPWVRESPETVQEVLTNMAFNLGVGGLLEFGATLRLMKAGRYAAAAAEMLRSEWADQVGDRAKRLAATLRRCEGRAGA